MSSSPERAARALATLSGLPATLRAWTEGLLSTRQQATGSGLIGEVNAVGDANVRSPCPGRQSRPPCGKPVFPRRPCACKCSAHDHLRKTVFSFTVGEPPLRPCSPLPRFMPPGGRHQARHSPHTPKLSCRVRSTRHASPCRVPCSALVHGQALENRAQKRYDARNHERPATRP